MTEPGRELTLTIGMAALIVATTVLSVLLPAYGSWLFVGTALGASPVAPRSTSAQHIGGGTPRVRHRLSPLGMTSIPRRRRTEGYECRRGCRAS